MERIYKNQSHLPARPSNRTTSYSDGRFFVDFYDKETNFLHTTISYTPAQFAKYFNLRSLAETHPDETVRMMAAITLNNQQRTDRHVRKQTASSRCQT